MRSFRSAFSALTLGALLTAGSAGAAFADPTSFALKSGGLTKITFESEAPLEDIVGVNNDVSGSVAIDLAAPSKGASGKVVVKVASFKTGIDMRDEHMRSPQWLNTEANPESIFELTKLDVKGKLAFGKKVKGTAHGKFTLNGVTRDIKVPVEIGYYEATDKLKQAAYIANHLLVISGEFDVKLKDYGIKGVEGLFGNKVSEEIEITLKLAGEQQ